MSPVGTGSVKGLPSPGIATAFPEKAIKPAAETLEYDVPSSATAELPTETTSPSILLCCPTATVWEPIAKAPPGEL